MSSQLLVLPLHHELFLFAHDTSSGKVSVSHEAFNAAILGELAVRGLIVIRREKSTILRTNKDIVEVTSKSAHAGVDDAVLAEGLQRIIGKGGDKVVSYWVEHVTRRSRTNIENRVGEVLVEKGLLVKAGGRLFGGYKYGVKDARTVRGFEDKVWDAVNGRGVLDQRMRILVGVCGQCGMLRKKYGFRTGWKVRNEVKAAWKGDPVAKAIVNGIEDIQRRRASAAGVGASAGGAAGGC